MNKILKPRNLLVRELHSSKYFKRVEQIHKKYNRSKSKKECNEYVRAEL